MARHRDGPAIILHHKDNRCFEDTSEIERLVEITFRGSTVATNGYDHVRFLLILDGLGKTNGVEHLGSEGNLEG